MKKELLLTLTKTYISEQDICNGDYSLKKKYYTNSISLLEEDLHSLDIDLFINGSFSMNNLPNLNYISEKVSIEKDCYIKIRNCPNLKTLPKSLTSSRRNIYFYGDQHLITILSKEQVNSLLINIENTKMGVFYPDGFIQINSYEEYHAFVIRTLEKNKLLNICNL